MYLPRHNTEFSEAAEHEGTAFVAPLGIHLPDILCEHHKRVVGNDNCVSFAGLSLQLPRDDVRPHYAKVRVRVHRYVDETLAVFHGPRKLGEYDAQDQSLQKALKRATKSI
jgi:hypothetical protein